MQSNRKEHKGNTAHRYGNRRERVLISTTSLPNFETVQTSYMGVSSQNSAASILYHIAASIVTHISYFCIPTTEKIEHHDILSELDKR